MSENELAEHWEARYGQQDRIWSGAPNASLVSVLEHLPAGTAIDLGAGEGGDALWLAERGWRVTAYDISTTALSRLEQAAAERGVSDRIATVVGDLANAPIDGTVDLVTASFLHSTVQIPRIEILRRFAGAVQPGGHLFVLGHATPPPWASPEMHQHAAHLVGPHEEVEQLDLDPAAWSVEVADLRQRAVTDPDGQPATIDDSVVLLRRASAGS
ncbi:SAM-dependent methyltransferase [Branchiibius hedensis]|nr:class I SAM-dependent methyltransferase [Branchiibius hedensis]